jgi:hypothetical protein
VIVLFLEVEDGMNDRFDMIDLDMINVTLNLDGKPCQDVEPCGPHCLAHLCLPP